MPVKQMTRGHRAALRAVEDGGAGAGGGEAADGPQFSFFATCMIEC